MASTSDVGDSIPASDEKRDFTEDVVNGVARAREMLGSSRSKADLSVPFENEIEENLDGSNNDVVEAAINALLVLEKKTRVAGDYKNLKEVCLQLIRLLRGAGRYDKLCSCLAVISKRRSQSKVYFAICAY